MRDIYVTFYCLLKLGGGEKLSQLGGFLLVGFFFIVAQFCGLFEAICKRGHG